MTCGDFTKPNGVVISCPNIGIDIDTLSLTASLNLCAATGAGITVEVKDSTFGVDFTHDFALGDDVEEPIPGISLDVPFIGSVGFFADVGLTISAGILDIYVGVNVCGEVLGVSVCGSSVISELPYKILEDKIRFSDVCSSPPPPPSPPGPGPSPGPPSPSPAPPSPPGEYHYGNPAQGCETSESASTVTGVTGDFCSPPCSSALACPTDPPPGTTARGLCVLVPGYNSMIEPSATSHRRVLARSSTDPSRCALICNGGLVCPPGASCGAVQGTSDSICTYPGGPSPSPPPSPPGGINCDDGSSCPSSSPICCDSSFGGCCPANGPVMCDTADVPISAGKCCSGDYPLCTTGGCSTLDGVDDNLIPFFDMI